MMKSSAQYSHDQIKSGNRGKGGNRASLLLTQQGIAKPQVQTQRV
jgi:hypothetical protein